MSNVSSKQERTTKSQATEVLIYGLIVILTTTIGTGIAAFLTLGWPAGLAGSAIVALYWFLTLRD